MATIHDVARIAGVGIGTVSRVVNQSHGVKTATREKVQYAIEQLKYTPDPIARSMISRRTGSIGVIVSLLMHSSCREVLQGMEAAAARLEHQLVLYNVRDTAQRDRYFSDLPMHRKVDGIIILSLTPDELEAQRMREIGLPVVLVDAYSPSLTSLVVKREHGVSRVVKSLLRQGHHRIGWITDLRAENTVWNKANNMFPYFQHFSGEEGFTVEPECILVDARNRQEGRTAAFQLLSRTDRPTAIVTAPALQSVEVLEAAHALDIAVPDALSVIGFNDVEMAEWLGLSTIQPPMDEMSEWSVRQLVDQMQNPTLAPTLLTFEMTCVERHTTTDFARSWERYL
ncbi:MAG: substrate-binding domain-containing protein [Ktedonobacteraceae bacterium]